MRAHTHTHRLSLHAQVSEGGGSRVLLRTSMVPHLAKSPRECMEMAADLAAWCVCVCVCVCVCARARARVPACVCACVRACVSGCEKWQQGPTHGHAHMHACTRLRTHTQVFEVEPRDVARGRLRGGHPSIHL